MNNELLIIVVFDSKKNMMFKYNNDSIYMRKRAFISILNYDVLK
jgi:hypothetical protein